MRLIWPKTGNDAIVEAATLMNNRIAKGRQSPEHPLGDAVIGKATDN